MSSSRSRSRTLDDTGSGPVAPGQLAGRGEPTGRWRRDPSPRDLRSTGGSGLADHAAVFGLAGRRPVRGTRWPGDPPGGRPLQLRAERGPVFPPPAGGSPLRSGGRGHQQDPALHAPLVEDTGRRAGPPPVRDDRVPGGVAAARRRRMAGRAAAPPGLPGRPVPGHLPIHGDRSDGARDPGGADPRDRPRHRPCAVSTGARCGSVPDAHVRLRGSPQAVQGPRGRDRRVGAAPRRGRAGAIGDRRTGRPRGGAAAPRGGFGARCG